MAAPAGAAAPAPGSAEAELRSSGVFVDAGVEIGTEIARGSFGRVYKATLFGEDVCAKVGGLLVMSMASLRV
jgi:hypothetical protein